jgi:hypothetical protein
MADRDAALRVLGEMGWRLLVDAGLAVDETTSGNALAAAAKLAAKRADALPEDRSAALEMVTEGARLALKLGIDERLLAVRGAVEQATPARVATWHANQLVEGCRLLEIGCGCGSDSLALAHRAANLIATDIDPVRAACTHTNLMTFGIGTARAIPGDGFAVLADEGSRATAVFVDPDRRPDGKRTLDPEAWLPPLSAVTALLDTGRSVYVKAAPSLDADDVDERFSVTYVSSGGECVEAFLAGGPDVPEGDRVRAVFLPADGPSEVLSGDRDWAATGPLGASLYVADPAAIRASLLAELCTRHDLGLVDEGIALLTGASGVATPWLTEFVVRDSLPMHPKRLRAAVRKFTPTQVRVHCRGVPLSAPAVEHDLRKKVDRGSSPALDVFITRVAGTPTAVLGERVSAPRPGAS